MYITSVIKQWHNSVAKLITVCRLTNNRKQISLLIDPYTIHTKPLSVINHCVKENFKINFWS